MTQYYEADANILERMANETNDHGEQSRLWAEASLIGTVVEWCPSGLHELWPKGAAYSWDCKHGFCDLEEVPG